MGFKLDYHTEVSKVTTLQDPTLGIMKWGESNSFPQTLVNFIGKSANAYPTVTRTAQFLKGQGFEGDDVVIGPNGMTGKDVLNIICDDYSIFKALALQCNYNLIGEVTMITPMRIPVLRFNEFDELNYASKIGYHPNFGLNSVEKKTIIKIPNRGSVKWFNRFNPSAVEDQIQNDSEGIIGNYNGQILYYSNSGHSSYPIPPLQAPINFVLSDIDNSILVRKETATGFVSTYLLKSTLSAESPVLSRLEQELYYSQGARGSGNVITLSELSADEVNGNVLEEIGPGGSGAKATIESAILTYELDQKAISGAYLIPPILAGFGIQNGFTGMDLSDAYDVFNAVTAPDRLIIEEQLNKVISSSVFKEKIPAVKIIPLSIEGVKQASNSQGDSETPQARNPLTGRQEQALQRIVRNYNKGRMTREQAKDQLINDFQLSDDRVETWLGPEQ